MPPSLGGAGVEIQMERTAAGLRSLGHDVVQVEAAEADAAFDVLHAFSSEPHVWHLLRHWTRNRCPLVLSPVIVVSPGRDVLLMRLSARLPGVVTSSRMRRELLHRADAVVALTEYERTVVTRAYGVPPERVRVIGNGVDVADTPEPADLPALPERYALLVGAVSQRKRQAEIVRALAGELPVVVAGGFAGAPSELGEWERTVEQAGALWLGDVRDRAVLQAVQRRATAQVLVSGAEGQSLAVLEALAVGTPVVLSDIPSHRELHVRFPDKVRLVRDPGECGAAIRGLSRDGTPAPIPSWKDVAADLAGVYESVLSG